MSFRVFLFFSTVPVFCITWIQSGKPVFRTQTVLMAWCGNGACTITSGVRQCQCYDGWAGTYCNITVETPRSEPSSSLVASIVVPVILGLVVLCTCLKLFVYRRLFCQYKTMIYSRKLSQNTIKIFKEQIAFIILLYIIDLVIFSLKYRTF